MKIAKRKRIVNKKRKYHTNLTDEHWQEFSFFEQMANVGSEVERTIKWKNKENLEYSRMAFERALELLDLTISDPKNRKGLKEILRVREALADYFAFSNEYKSTDKSWQNYFYSFNFAARLGI
ncbi:MAG: hypothetical protein A2271_04240 [Candidatus Moranbacteria bacterium RIFOXYA12_FULL_35_19]|nr:MAG: hypothetical protein A2343_03745 [Candidatus Moranbacteria bacterium RIFOXYB12_FULL_35_8]OGI32072.1 MAG: hypothetical protein A2489_00080 [Candidatus Moranbacteria bacterium RIFOXYC12_FULL_36_13]OGI35356.1 MAG: hypothetical protein A2271_04240 [Candidatus Moranbacteria bacterium RIFOXYA12_FULL_35_19]